MSFFYSSFPIYHFLLMPLYFTGFRIVNPSKCNIKFYYTVAIQTFSNISLIIRTLILSHCTILDLQEYITSLAAQPTDWNKTQFPFHTIIEVPMIIDHSFICTCHFLTFILWFITPLMFQIYTKLQPLMLLVSTKLIPRFDFLSYDPFSLLHLPH